MRVMCFEMEGLAFEPERAYLDFEMGNFDRAEGDG